jgi:EPS-associated MarR family transcriptional regulator
MLVLFNIEQNIAFLILNALPAHPMATKKGGGSVLKTPQMMPMTRQQQLQEDTHFRVLSLLESQPDLNQREMAKALGVSLGGVNYCLRALAAKGLVKMSSFQASENKLAYAYLLTPQGMTEKIALTGSFLKRKQQEYAALKAEIEALQKAVAEAPESGQ